MTAKEEDVRTALRVAFNAVYFADSSDYVGALWSVVAALDPEAAAALEFNDAASQHFKRLNEE